jgi:hypothetical protein
MKKYSKFWLAAFSLGGVAFAGCTNEEDLGARSKATDGGSSDGSTPATLSDASTPSPDAGEAPPIFVHTEFGTTAAGESCSPSDYPPAAASCAIAGLYTVTESWCHGGACGATAPTPDVYQWVANVTVSGTEVKLTNGTNRLFHCQLSTACDCVVSNGSLIRFSGDAFVSVEEGADCPGGSSGIGQYIRSVGAKL